jgi:hypothetical protein
MISNSIVPALSLVRGNLNRNSDRSIFCTYFNDLTKKAAKEYTEPTSS